MIVCLWIRKPKKENVFSPHHSLYPRVYIYSKEKKKCFGDRKVGYG